MLKGFEEYAALRGYKATVSINSTFPGKISFKITIDEFGITSSRESIKNDLDDYINNIRNENNLSKASRYFDNIKDELNESKSPDKNIISKWLDKAKIILATAEDGSEVLHKAIDVYESFGSVL